MKTRLCLAALSMLIGCSGETRDAVTFRCTSSSGDNSDPERDVLFHFAEGHLFLQNDRGGADNVCTQAGTIACDVKMTRKTLTLRQTVEDSACVYRSYVQTFLDVDRETGEFRLVQQGCDPSGDKVYTGVCQSLNTQ